jgi:biotin carboxyl carrier protein
MNEYIVYVNDKKLSINLIDEGKFLVNGKEFFCELLPIADNSYILRVNNKFCEISALKNGNENFLITYDGKLFETTVKSKLQEKADQIIQNKIGTKKILEIKAPMPGMILKITKKVGDKIQKGETVLILEAMKMENDLRAPLTGSIKEIYIDEGTAVEKGMILFSME